MPFALFKSRRGIRRYLLMLATFGTVIQCIDFLNQAYAEVVVGLDSLFLFLANFSGLMYVVAALWLIYIGFVIFDQKNRKDTDEAGALLVWIWGGLLMVCALTVCFMMYDATIAGNADRYGGLGRYLVFNDSWGTNRGYIWRKSIELFQGFPPMHKSFGYGLETFGILTTGASGPIAYVVFLATAGRRMAMRRNENKMIVGCLFAVLCYSAQALVNIDLPIVTPIMWLLLSVGMAACREQT